VYIGISFLLVSTTEKRGSIEIRKLAQPLQYFQTIKIPTPDSSLFLGESSSKVQTLRCLLVLDDDMESRRSLLHLEQEWTGGYEMADSRNPQEAYRRGYTDGSRMAEQMRWQGTPIGNILKGMRYQPDQEFRAAYDDGFRQAMHAASRVEWTLPTAGTVASEYINTVGAPRWLSAA
jgi:hypothetical protein